MSRNPRGAGRATEPRRLRGLPRARLLGIDVPVATGLHARLLGLALMRRECAGAGLLIPRCRSVHTLGMLFAIDLVFLDRRGAVVEVRRGIPPGRLARSRRAAAVLELPSGGERGAPPLPRIGPGSRRTIT